jgi:PAS domain S-box-containing protein
VNEGLVRSLANLPEKSLTPAVELPGGDALGDGVIALKTKVPDAELSLVTLLPEEPLYGQITSRLFLIFASALPVILLLAMLMFQRIQNVKAALAQSEQRFQTIFENIRDGICIQDPANYAILEVNPRMMAMYGYGPNEMTGLTQADISENSPPYGAQEWAAKRTLAEAGNPQFFGWHARRKGGELFWVEISIFFIAIDGKSRMVVVAHDITQRMAQERELVAALEYQTELNRKIEEARSQLLQSEKMASIGQLAAGVAHEINNPVGFVRSNLHTLRIYVGQLLELLAAYEQVDVATKEPTAALERARAIKSKVDLAFLKEDVGSVFDDSSQGIERVIKIVKDLKDFSHVDREEKWNLDDLHQGLETTLSVIWNELKYKCEVKKEYGELPLVECLIFQLNQVFMNFLLNSAQAIERRGTITIRTGVAGDQDWVEIADDGKGIAEANLSRIFDPFFTTKPVGQGTGLGLSISYSIIKKHHGTITVDSREGGGTSFRICLPVVQPVAASSQTSR